MKWFIDLFRVWRRELWLSVTDLGVLIFFVALPLGYPIIYTLIYNPETIREIPMVIVDHSRTAESRDFVRTLSATPAIKIAGYAADMGEAKRAWAEKKCYSIMEIPSDYARQITQGQAVVSFYQDMSLLFRYRQNLFSLTQVQMAETAKVTAQRVADEAGGVSTLITGLPISTQSSVAGDPTQGFASFIMPGVIILILQQGMLMGIAMIAGTRRDRRRRDPLAEDRYEVGAGPFATVLGRAAAYLTIYLPMTYFVVALIPVIFSLPQAGHFMDYFPFIFVMLLATAFLGQTIQIFVRERETSMVLIVFTSVFVLFLSGLTWPRYAFPWFWKAISDLVPATWGVEGYIHIHSNGASLAEVYPQFLPLWGLTILYFITAILIRAYTYRRCKPRLA
ncbi:MAG: ABC transporter permease [Duncaniella sp.]|nr:ABC transporter permease [Duncaniella sp.]